MRCFLCNRRLIIRHLKDKRYVPYNQYVLKHSIGCLNKVNIVAPTREECISQYGKHVDKRVIWLKLTSRL